jgi:[ribulose-bisphosphate carboxylase]-lysine N-methyltransferase
VLTRGALSASRHAARTEAELAELEGSQLGASAASYRAYVADVWAGLQAGPLAAAPALFPAATFHAAAFAWAFGTLRARCLPPADAGPTIALVPGLDLVNHAAGAAPAWTPARAAGGGLLAAAAAAAGVGAAADAATAPAMGLAAGRAHAAGEQLYGSYGEGKLDSQTALDYGFADDAAPQPGYLLQLAIPETDRFVDDKLDVLDVARLPAAPQYALRPGAPPPPALRTFLRLLNLSGTDAFLLEPLFRDAVWNVIGEPVSLANERAACASMIDGCAAALAAYATTAAQDEQALRAPGGSARLDLVRRGAARVAGRPLAPALRCVACRRCACGWARSAHCRQRWNRTRHEARSIWSACLTADCCANTLRTQTLLAATPELEYYQVSACACLTFALLLRRRAREGARCRHGACS